jgi:NodT family efflux transporter outer membrane factor (OMF) lipoprotein
MRKKFILILLLLSSCKWQNEKAQLTKDVSLTKTVQDAKDSELFMIGDYPENKWWQEFNDDHLSCLIETALASNPGLLATKQRVEVANQTALMVRSQLFPDISTLFQYGWLYIADNNFLGALFPEIKNSYYLYNLMFNFNYELDFWGKNQKKYKSALGSAHATRLSYEQSKVILSTSIAKSYFTLLSMKAKKEVVEQMLSRKQAYYDLVKIREQNRIDSKLDQNTFNQMVKGVEETLIALTQEILLQSSLINILVGKNPEAEVETAKIYEAFNKNLEIPGNITTTLLARRPDLLSALWVTKKSALDVGVSVTEFLPDVTLMEAPFLISSQGNKLFNKDSFANILMPEITQPIFTGGRLLANWRKSIAAYESSVYEFNELFLNAAKEVYDSVTKYIESDEMKVIQQQKLHLAKKNYELQFLRFNNGISSMMDVLEYDEIYLQSKVVMIEKQRLQYMSYISFIKALGGGFEDQEAVKLE